MKKILAIILIACMLLCSISCQKEQDVAETDTGSDIAATDTEPIDGEECITLVENGKPLYAIVYTDTAYKDAALFLQSNLKNKTGVNFDLFSFEVDNYEHFIYIGYDYNKLELDGEGLTYSGYAIAQKDGNMYICGYQVSPIGSAVQKFCGAMDYEKHVIRGESVKAVIPTSVLMISNPAYSVQSPTLLDSSLSDYRIVVSKTANDITATLMKNLIHDIGKDTGLFIGKVSDASAAVDKEIIIGTTSRPQSEALISELNPDEYRIKNYGDTVYVAYGSLLAYSDAIGVLKALYGEAVEEEIDVKGTVSESYGLHKEDESYLRIMSSNVLFYVSDYRDDYFSSASRQLVNADCYLTYLPDVIGLQEVCDRNRAILERELVSAYAVVESEKSAYEYTPIFYRKDKYTVKESKFELFDVGGCWSYTWALFGEINDPEKEFIVVNLHYSPFSTESRMPGVLEMNEELKRLQELYSTTPIFVTGDYNSFVDSEEHEATFDGLNNPMLSGIEVAEQRGKDGFAMDHVAVTTNLVTVKQFQSIWNPIYEHGSDHVPIFIDVSINS